MENDDQLMASPPLRAPFFPRIHPPEAGTKTAFFEKAHTEIKRHYPKMFSFLVIWNGSLIYEQYYNGRDAASLHDLRSATKSFTSAVAGIAAGRGELPELDEPVLPLLHRYISREIDPMLMEVLTLRRLLTMTCGLEWETGKKLGEPLIRRFHRSRNWTSFALSLRVRPEMVDTFQYRSVDSHLISVLLTECCGTDAYNYAREYLFGPLGIEHAVWTPGPEGHSMGHVGLYLTSRDMAKFGVCCLQKGRWLGKRIIPQEWLNLALSPQVSGYPAFGDYGFQWWTGRMNGQDFACAHGHGGQQIYLFPESSAVVVFTADSKVNRWKNPRPLLQQYILNAFE